MDYEKQSAVETGRTWTKRAPMATGPGLRAGGVAAMFVVGILILGGCASGGGAATAAGPAPEARDPAPLEPGDAIEVAFSREPDQGGRYEIDATGTVGLPFLGIRQVTETRPDSLRTELLSAYREQLRNQTVEVRLLRRVRVLGAVNSPGLYYVDGTMTLADVVAQAGGASDEGKLEDIQIVRGEEVVRSDIRRGAGAFRQLESGDQVVVPKESWFARNSAVVISGTISALGFIIGVAAF